MGWAHESGAATSPIPDRVLTPGEQILAASDRASAPLTCGLLVQTDGQLDPRRLRAAVWTVMRRHPMTRAVLYGSRQHAWRFVAEPTSDPFGFVDDGTEAWRVHEVLASAPFDLRRFPPLRVVLVRQPGGDQLSVVAHHLALDGLRLTRLATEILAVYRQSPGEWGIPGAFGAAGGDGELRGMPAGVGPVVRTAPSPWATMARRSGRYVVPLTTGRGEGYGFHPMVLALPTGDRTLADGRRMTINDLLLAAAHLAIDRWNTRRGGQTGCLRIRMPIDLATAAGPAPTPATTATMAAATEMQGNHTGQALIISEAADRRDPARLAARVVDQTVEAKGAIPPPVPGVSGALGVAMARYVPGPWRSGLLRIGVAAARPLLAPTAAVSNLGRHDDVAGPVGGSGERGRYLVAVGDAGRAALPGPAVTAAYFTGTAGMPQGLFLGVMSVGGALNVTVCYHRQMFGPESVPAFAELFRAAYLEVGDPTGNAAAEPTGVRPPSPSPSRSGRSRGGAANGASVRRLTRTTPRGAVPTP
ncbi:condensation domain-containing protein [Candidatus Frankia nodulisporulans]|uniref:condensation domain-containing protein n=1 Tax=Candidatus Frankia nodulisporulans TaxID=2060052 RepID=UPI0013CF5555|nr:condensation domain-containing protein [Candidatus Frankia nodulisporulans]